VPVSGEAPQQEAATAAAAERRTVAEEAATTGLEAPWASQRAGEGPVVCIRQIPCSKLGVT
jgi:hypothetical protein